jgi:hypothetical protein
MPEEPLAKPTPAPGADEELAPRPRWVIALFVAAGAVLVLVVVLMLAGGHSPGRHGASPTGSHGGAQLIAAG